MNPSMAWIKPFSAGSLPPIHLPRDHTPHPCADLVHSIQKKLPQTALIFACRLPETGRNCFQIQLFFIQLITVVQVFSGLAESLLRTSTATHTVGLVVTLVWTDSGESLVPRKESKGDLQVVCQKEPNLGVGISWTSKDKLSPRCDGSRASRSDEVTEKQEEKNRREGGPGRVKPSLTVKSDKMAALVRGSVRPI